MESANYNLPKAASEIKAITYPRIKNIFAATGIKVPGP
jgi:hypothetical protein